MARRAKTTSSPRPPRPVPHAVGWKYLTAIFLLAAAYRGACFASAGDHPLLRYPIVDAGYHDAWARRMAGGDWLGHGPDDVFKPPGYPWMLAGVYRLCGRSIAVVQVLQHLAGAATCVLIALLAGHLLGPWPGRVAGLLAATYAPFVFFELQLLTPAASLLLNALAAWLILRGNGDWLRSEAQVPVPVSGARSQANVPASASGPPDERPFVQRILPALSLLAGGGVLGVSAAVRPDVLLPAGLVLAALVWRDRGAGWARRAAKVALASAGVVAVIAAVAVRNHRITGQLVAVSSNAGINLYVGNVAADGTSAVPVGLRWERLVATVPQDVLEKPASAGALWRARTWREARARPGETLGRLGRKALAFLNAREFRNNISLAFFQALPEGAFLGWPLLQYAAIVPLGICGLVCLFRGRPEQQTAAWLCALWVGGYWLAGVAFFVTARFRLPAVPALIPPASWAIVRAVRAVRQRKVKALLVHAAVFAASAGLCWPAWLARADERHVRDLVNLGTSLQNAEDLAGAERAFSRAVARKANDPDARYRLGRLLARRSPPAGMVHLRRAREVLPDSPDVLLALGQTYLASRRPAEAQEPLHELIALAETCNLQPKRAAWATAHVLLANLDRRAAEGHWARAWAVDARTAAEAAFVRRRDLKRVLSTFADEAARQPWDWYSQANYGMVLLEVHRPAKAAEAFATAARLAPEREALRLHRARALAAAGHRAEATRRLEKLLAELPPCPLRAEARRLRAQLAGPTTSGPGSR